MILLLDSGERIDLDELEKTFSSLVPPPFMACASILKKVLSIAEDASKERPFDSYDDAAEAKIELADEILKAAGVVGI